MSQCKLALLLLALAACSADDGKTTNQQPLITEATGCPSLAGIYDCPAILEQPEFTLTVTESYSGEVAAYLYSYDWAPAEVADEQRTFSASVNGVADSAGWISTCLEYGGRPALSYGPPSGTSSQITTNFINADGDYQADVDGSRSLLCRKR